MRWVTGRPGGRAWARTLDSRERVWMRGWLGNASTIWKQARTTVLRDPGCAHASPAPPLYLFNFINAKWGRSGPPQFLWEQMGPPRDRLETVAGQLLKRSQFLWRSAGPPAGPPRDRHSFYGGKRDCLERRTTAYEQQFLRRAPTILYMGLSTLRVE